MTNLVGLRHEICVLCIEDEEELRLDLVEELEDTGFAVTGVESGEAALELLQRETFSVILCDIRLPGMSGIDLVKWIRQEQNQRSHIPVIVLSAYDDEPLRCSLRSNGVSVFLVKPVEYEAVIDHVLALVSPTPKLPDPGSADCAEHKG